MKRIVIIILIIGIAFLGILYFSKSKNGKIVQGEGFEAAAGGLLQEISAHAASNDVDILVDSGLQGLAFFGLLDDVCESLSCSVDLIDTKDVIPGSLVDREIRNTGVVIYE